MTPSSHPRTIRPARSDGIRRGGGRRRPGRAGHRDPPQAARRAEGQRSLGGGARKGLRARRAHPVRRDHGPARDHRAVPELEGARRAAEPGGHGATSSCSSAKPARRARPSSCCPTASRTTATTSSAWATWCAGWASRPRRWAWRSSPASPPPKCSTTTTARSRAWPPATWAWARTASRTTASSSAWSCTRKYTIFAEGARGHLGKQLIARFKLDAGRDPQSYGIGLKELWEIDPAETPARPAWCTPPAGRSTRTPTAARSSTTLDDNQVALGFVVGLDYSNPWLSPFEEFQRWKTHPAIRKYARRRQAHRLRRARHHRGRHPEPAQDGVPGRRAGRLRSGLPERQRASRAATPPSRPACWPPKLRSTRLSEGRQHDELGDLPGSVRRKLAARRARPCAQLQAVVQEGPLDGHADDRHRAVAAAQARLQGAAVDAAPRRSRPHLPASPPPTARRSSTPSPTASSPSTG